MIFSLAAKEWVGLTSGAMWLALILALLAGAIKMTRDYRRGRLPIVGVLTGRAASSESDAHQSLTKFRELHERGGLSDDEYRFIKSKLASELTPDEETSPAKPNPKDNLALVESLKAAMASEQDESDGDSDAGDASE